MIRKKTMKRKKIHRKKKPIKIYKYLVSYWFNGDIQKVEVEKEGKKEAIVKMIGKFGKSIFGKRIFKETLDHSLCDTLEDANAKLLEYKFKRIKTLKKEIKEVNTEIKELKRG